MIAWQSGCQLFSWLLGMSVPLSLLLFCLLAARQGLHRTLGARYQYVCWALVPALLLIVLLPPSQQISDGISVYQLQAVAGKMNSEVENQLTASPWLLGVWLTGVALLLMTLAYQWGGLVALLQQSTRLQVETTSTSCQRVQYRLSKQLIGPLITGLWHPVVLLPADFRTRFTQAQQQQVISHELTHWQRGDLHANAAALFILILFWFNPLCWWAYRAYRLDQELACDAVVLANATTTEKISYSYALLYHSESTATSHWPLANHIYGNKQMMKQRLLQLQRPQRMSKLLSTIVLSLLAAVMYWLSALTKADGLDALLIMRVEPKYPVAAARQKIAGFTRAELEIDSNGLVVAVQIIESSPTMVFDKVSVAALQQWRFKPVSGRSVKKVVQLDFLLDPSPPV